MIDELDNQLSQWKVIFTDCFKKWMIEQDVETRKSVLSSLKRLEMFGPALTRPYADTLKNSAYKKMKELRVQHKGKPIRVFFAFDPLRQAIVLCAGDKSNDKQFYVRMLRLAEQEFSHYLNNLENKSE
ncbi:type II toxin-antitoxin system RelE/ParE family toxin [Mannheimia indoligenes]|uniref:type II toxin-antitoxin system RelE/ParE family toxin n=1 Tax=Mannheimia indoligenes TaxID=3103145 RepID=UPI002FE665B3